MKFAHFSDCHLGGWRQPELNELNFLSFKKAVDICIDEKVDFILITGDLFDSAYPPIEILKRTFAEFKRLIDEKIKCYLIAGSHDYSVSGKTFLDVLEKGGFCKICEYENSPDENGKIILKPLKHIGVSIYGYPGKKSGLEIADLKRVEIKEDTNFKILMLHTTLTEAKGSLPIDSISLKELPSADYYALGHLHMDFELSLNGKPVIYGGPIFPNNFQELEELKHGRFYLVEVNGYTKVTKKEIKLKEVVIFSLKIKNSLTATANILSEFDNHDLKDKIVLLKLSGTLEQGKTSDINFQEIQEYLKTKEAYSFLKNTGKLIAEEQEFEGKIEENEMEKIEGLLIDKYKNENPNKFNELILPLFNSLGLEKQEDEKSAIFEARLFDETNKILKINLR